ncbi:MAG: hypothetical protein ACH350_07685 [Parachlamydiaceae bacterium]
MQSMTPEPIFAQSYIQRAQLQYISLPLRQELEVLKEALNQQMIVKDAHSALLRKWVESFQNALCLRKEEAIDSSFIERLDTTFVQSLQDILKDPLSDAPLDETALLAADGFLYNASSLKEGSDATSIFPHYLAPFFKWLEKRNGRFFPTSTRSKPNITLLTKPRPRLLILRLKPAPSPPIDQDILLEKRLERLRAAIHTPSQAPSYLQINLFRRRLYAELTEIERLLNTSSCPIDAKARVLKAWVLAFKKKMHEAPFRSEEDLLREIETFFSSLLTDLPTASSSSSLPQVPHGLRANVLHRQLQAELAGLKEETPDHFPLNDALSSKIRAWILAFPRALRERNEDPFFLQGKLEHFTQLLKEILGEHAASGVEEIHDVAACSFLRPILNWLSQRAPIRAEPAEAKQESRTSRLQTAKKRVLSQKNVREEKRKQEQETAEARFEERKEELASQVKTEVKTYFEEHIDPIYSDIQTSTIAALAQAEEIQREDDAALEQLEHEIEGLEEDIQELYATHLRIAVELDHLNERIHEAEIEELKLQDTVNALHIATKQMKKAAKESTWRAIASIGISLLSSYVASSLSGFSVALTPARAGSGGNITLNIPLNKFTS